jgi:hypothetical protein
MDFHSRVTGYFTLWSGLSGIGVGLAVILPEHSFGRGFSAAMAVCTGLLAFREVMLEVTEYREAMPRQPSAEGRRRWLFGRSQRRGPPSG